MKQLIIKQLHNELRDIPRWIPQKVEELYSILSTERQVEHVRLLSIYSAKGNTKIKTQLRYKVSCHSTKLLWAKPKYV
jgi:hypothetical protein